MDYKDVTIGMKVVPHKKSIGCNLRDSNVFRYMRFRGQPYLYVTHQHADDKMNGSDRFMLSDDERDINIQGDYFKSSDFEPYQETK